MLLAVLLVTLLAGLWVGVGVVAGVFCLRGWRGTMLDRHPHCRACGHDLFGSAAPRARCPECGISLAPPGRVCIGQRAVRVRMIVTGLGLFALCLLPLLPHVAANWRTPPQAAAIAQNAISQRGSFLSDVQFSAWFERRFARAEAPRALPAQRVESISFSRESDSLPILPPVRTTIEEGEIAAHPGDRRGAGAIFGALPDRRIIAAPDFGVNAWPEVDPALMGSFNSSPRRSGSSHFALPPGSPLKARTPAPPGALLMDGAIRTPSARGSIGAESFAGAIVLPSRVESPRLGK